MKRQFLSVLIVVPAAALLLGAMAGCSSDDSTATGTANLTFSSTNAAHTVALTPMQRLWRAIGSGTAHAVTGLLDFAGNAVELTDFQISIREVKLKQELQDATGLAEDSVDFDGPFAVDLINDVGDPIAQTIGTTPVPAGNYDGIRFVMHKDAANTGPLANNSIYIAGNVTIGANPRADFVMTHDTGENFDFFGPNPIVVDLGVINDLVVDFKLISVIEAIDFGTAVNLMDINPDAVAGADSALADALKEAIKAAADFGEDDDGDDLLDETEDVD